MAVLGQGSAHLETVTWENRLRMGEEAENAFADEMKRRMFTVCHVSQHRDSPQNRLARHFPDMYIPELAVFVQVKNGINSSKWDNVIAEKDSYNACMECHELGSKVWMVWLMPDGDFRGSAVEHLEYRDEISDKSRRNGSGTPGVKIAKSSLLNLDGLIGHYTQLSLW